MPGDMEHDNILHILYGNRPKTMVIEALTRRGLAEALGSGMTVGLKPNLVVAKPAASGATTSAELIEGVVEYLYAHGFRRIRIMESAAAGHCTKQAFSVTGLVDVAKRFGVQLIDLKDEPVETVSDGSFQTRIFSSVRQVDFLINMPVVKAHSQTRITCALKNLKGLIPDSEKRRFHSRGLHEPIARLNTLIRPHLIIADGIQGDLSFEEGGTPVQMDRILIAKDPVLLDSHVAAMLGYRKDEVRHLMLAEQLGVGSSLKNPEQVVELNRPTDAPRVFERSRRLDPLVGKIDAREACSICFGSLIHALERFNRRGRLKRIEAPLQIGQGFKRKSGEGIGIGTCARGFSASVEGCPPQAVEIFDFLETHFDK